MPSAVHSADVASLLQWWRAQELDVSFLPTPIAEHAFATGIAPQRLRCLLVGGDRLRQVPDGLPFSVYNNYGPTETTVVASSGVVTPGMHNPPIGRPLPYLRAYVLDAQGQLAPLGVVGELYLGGAGVARGYLGREALTAERFINDPFYPGERMYSSADASNWAKSKRICCPIHRSAKRQYGARGRGGRAPAGGVCDRRRRHADDCSGICACNCPSTWCRRPS